VLAVALFFALLLAFRSTPASACGGDGPCASPIEKVLCPSKPAGSSGTGVATFNIPKDARNIEWVIRDAITGKAYDFYGSEVPNVPICADTTMVTKTERIPGATEDTLKVTYTLTSDGNSDENEAHDVVVVAEWDREADLEVTKLLLGGADETIGAEEERTFAVTVHNHGPAPTNGFDLTDNLIGKGLTPGNVTGAEQVAGPKATKPVSVDENGIVYGEWAKLEPGEEVTVLVRVRFSQVGDFLNEATVEHSSRSHRIEPGGEYRKDLDPHGNTDVVKFTVKPAPDSRIGAARADGVSGTAKGPAKAAGTTKRLGPPALFSKAGSVRKVKVAILRLGGGKPLDGGLPEAPTRSPGSCKWLGSRNGRAFKTRLRSTGGVCDSPVWLGARGTTSWSLSLKNALPPGRYVVYSRAVGANGVAESVFTAKDGNRKPLFVH
jgi:Domain of unknown function DUF11